MTTDVQPCVIVHGGAFNIPEPYITRYRNGTQAAAKAGYECLSEGGSALDAVEQAVKAMEDNPIFNAGHGSVLTEIGTVEMDSIVVDVQTGKTGAVACIHDIANPVSLARKVMEKTPHCLLVGHGAMRFAKSINFPLVENPSEMITNESACKSFKFGVGTFNAHIDAYMNKIVMAKDIDDLEEAFKQSLSEEGGINKENSHDTVGAIAIDNEGRLASATSTGGMPGKLLGRVGDSPLYGCGAYGNKFGACSSTGHGESLIKSNICRQAVYYLEQG